MIDHHTLEDFIDVLLIQSLLQGIRGQFDRAFHLSQCLFDLQIPDLFRSFQTLICKREPPSSRREKLSVFSVSADVGSSSCMGRLSICSSGNTMVCGTSDKISCEEHPVRRTVMRIPANIFSSPAFCSPYTLYCFPINSCQTLSVPAPYCDPGSYRYSRNSQTEAKDCLSYL